MIRLNQKQSERTQIAKSAYVTVTDMGHIVEVQHMEKRNTTCHIQKIDSDRYVVLDTGEIMEFNKSENRSDNENSLRQTFKKMRYLINSNFKGLPNELHITMTYKENMMDTKRLYGDFDKFMKRLRYKYKTVSTVDYMNVVEPQGRGAWHIHMLIRFNDLESVYVPNSELAEMWGQGFVKIKSLKDVDNIGAYLSAYLADLELDRDFSLTEAMSLNGKELSVKQVDGVEKKFIKGGRLHMYPPGINLFRKSKGIVYPERQEMTYKNAKKIVGSAEPHYNKTYMVEKDDFKNTITFEQYNLKR